VDTLNHKQLVELKQPIALVEAEHTGNSKKMGSSVFMGLVSVLFLAVFAKVVLTSNVCQPAGLCNGATGKIMDIVYEEGTQAPAMPKYVWVDFGNQYKGPSFFPNCEERRGWVPVHPMTAREVTFDRGSEGNFKEHSRKMLPLRLAWAWTIWKAQGQTIHGKVVVDLGPTEKEHGLTYTALSRIKKLLNLGIMGGLSFDRFTKKIKKHSKVAGRIVEESRLRQLAANTVAYLKQKRADRAAARAAEMEEASN